MSRSGVAVVVAAVAVAVLVGYQLATWPPAPPSVAPAAPVASPAPDSAASPGAGTGTPSADTRAVSVLADTPTFNRGGWLRSALEGGQVDGYAAGPIVTRTGAETAALAGLVDRVRTSDVVLVQAGRNDVLAGAAPADVATAVSHLVTRVRAAGPEVVLVTLSPLGDRPADVSTTNALLRRWAANHQVPVLDVTSPVAAPDGSWATGMSTDGMDPSAAGRRAVRSAVLFALPGLLLTASSAT